MIIYGINAVTEALLAGEPALDRILVTRGKFNPRLQKIVDLARQANIPLFFEPVEALHRKAQTTRHQDAVAEIAEVGRVELDDILEESSRLLLAVDGVEDPRNLGAVLRTAEAAGVDGVLIPERRTCGVTPAVVQASAGAALHLRISRVGNLVQALERAKSRGFWVAGLDMQGQHRPEDVAQGQPLVVVIGGEHHGVRRLVREHCDFLVSLPMRGRVPSLNLSVATGILLYQLTRHVEVQAPVSSDGAATGPSRAWAGGPRKSTSRAVKPSNGRS